jgi:hypothetical protein
MANGRGFRKLTMTGLAAAVALATAGGAVAKDKPAKGKDAKADPVARGGYIVASSGCNHCHTPWVFNKELGMPVPDMTRMLSGHPAKDGAESATKINPKTDLAIISADFTAFTLPFGTVYTANLTPDQETGIGSWTEEMFVKAMRTGMHLGAENGRPILPPMPWTDLKALNDDDLKAVFAFLKSIPAIHNPIPDPKVPKPVIEAMTKAHPKMLEMIEAAHKAPAPAPAASAAATPAAVKK